MLTIQQLTSLDIEYLHNIAMKNPDNCCMQKLICMVINCIAENDNLARIRLWIWPNDILQIFSNQKLKIGGEIRRHSPNTNFCDVIVSESIPLSLNAFNIGVKLNSLREDLIPNFLYTYHYLEAMRPLLWKENVHVWFLPPMEQRKSIPHIFVENIGLSSPLYLLIREIKTFSHLASLFCQCLLALSEANLYCGFLHNHICNSTIMVRNANDLQDKWSIYTKNNIKVRVFEDIPIFQDYEYSEISGPIIYDLYHLCRLFIKNIMISQSFLNPGPKEFCQMLRELLGSLGIPQWYLIDIENIKCGVCKNTNTLIFPKETTDATYKDIIGILISFTDKYQLGEILQRDESSYDQHVCDTSTFFKKCNHNNDTFLTLSCSSLSIGSIDNMEEMVTHQNKHTDTLKKSLEQNYTRINTKGDGILPLNHISWPIIKEGVQKQCLMRVDLYLALLEQKIILDELDCILYCSKLIRDNIDNDNLENYIAEHRAKLMRLYGEYKTIYDNSKFVLSWEQEELLEYISYIILNKSVKTR